MIEKIIEKAKKENKPVYVYAHKFPDGDAISSANAIVEYLKNNGIDCRYIVSKPIYNYSKIFNSTQPTKSVSKNSISVIIDTSTLDYTENQLFLSTAPNDIFIIDHHLKETGIICIEDELNVPESNVLRDSSASSTCEILANEFSQSKMSPKLATMLTLGLITDTAKLRFLKPNTLQNLQFLLENGANYDLVISMYDKKSNLKDDVGLSKILLNAQKINIGNTFGLILIVDNATANSINSHYGIRAIQKRIFKITNIENCSFACFAVENNKGEFDIEFRSSSIYGNFNVQKLATTLGGGGHHNASGCHLKENDEFSKETISSSIIQYVADFYENQATELTSISLNDNDTKLSAILDKTSNLTKGVTPFILSKVAELNNAGANYQYLFSKFKTLKRFMLENELLNRIPYNVFNQKCPEINISLYKHDVESLKRKYNCTEDEILELISIFENIYIQSATIEIPGNRKAKIDSKGNISYIPPIKKR
jgi:phosphoesterase RecJ-like protein